MHVLRELFCLPTRVRGLVGASLLAGAILDPAAAATNAAWSGAVSSDFETAGNWAVFPVDDLTSHDVSFAGAPTNQPQLTQSRSVAGLRFTTAPGGWVLGTANATNTLALGTGGLIASGAGTATNTIAAKIAVDGTQTWQTATGGTLLFTAFPAGRGGSVLTVGTSSNAGRVVWSPASGGPASYIASNGSSYLLNVRAGVLELGGDGTNGPVTSGTNTLLNQGSGGALVVASPGLLRVNSGTWQFGDLSRNSSDAFSGAIEVRGGTLSFNGARYLGTGAVRVAGGTLRVTGTNASQVNAGRFSPGAIGTSGVAVVEITSGLVDLAQANGVNSFGASASTRVFHSGGTLQNGITPGGGLNGGVSTNLVIGPGGITSNNQTAYTLSGSGVLVCSGTILGQAPTTGTNVMNNFNLNGGTLAAGVIDATNLGYASATGLAGGGAHTNPVANSVGRGTLYNNGTRLAPGGPGISGRMQIAGDAVINSGELAVDLGGTNRATLFRDGDQDMLEVTGSLTLGGTLSVHSLGGFLPTNGQEFVVATAASVSGAFASPPPGEPVAVSDGSGMFTVLVTNNSVVLSNFQALTDPIITTNPSPASVQMGLPVTLTAGAASAVPVTWQWRLNGTNLAGATNASLTLFPARLSDAGLYDVVISNQHGSTTSLTAALTVTMFATNALGERLVTYDTNGVQSLSSVPAFGVHPRIYFNAEDLPAIRARLTNTVIGREALTMIQYYSSILRSGRSVYDSLPATNRTMPDGTPRISNVGLYDQSVYYTNLVAGSTNNVASLATNGSGSTFAYVLSSSMALEAFDCLVKDGQPGVAQRMTNVATALATWAEWANAQSTNFYPGVNSASAWRFGGSQSALVYDLAYNAMTPTQRAAVRAALARMAAGHIDEGYYGVNVAPEAANSNWALIFSFRIFPFLAIEGEVTESADGLSSEAVAEYITGVMNAVHKYCTYGIWPGGEPFEGQGKNALYGCHLIPWARRGWNFYAHPHVKAYARQWMPATVQPFGYSFTLYDLLGGTGFNPEKGRMYVVGSDYIALKWMYPGDNSADFLLRNYVLTEYKTNGNWQTFLDLRDGKVITRSIYQNTLLPTAIFASDITGTNLPWSTQARQVLGATDYLSKDGATLISRSGFDTNAMSFLVHIRQDFGGHTFADRNAFTLSALGRIFVNYNSGDSDSGLESNLYHTVVNVDGQGMKLTFLEGQKMRIPAKLAAWATYNSNAVFVTGDATYAYSQEWRWQDYSSTTGTPVITSGYAADSNSFNDFRRADNRIPEAYGNTPFVAFPDWLNGGMNEGIQAKAFNPMRQVIRTAGHVKGTRPYALIVDDVRKDDAARRYEWRMSIATDLVLVAGGSLPIGAVAATDIVLQEPPATGDRRLLVRVLRADGTPVYSGTEGSSLGYALRYTNGTDSWKMFIIERSNVVDAAYRVLLFPFRSGDTLPTTVWTNGYTNLIVTINGQTDHYKFHPRDVVVQGQSVTLSEFVLARNGTNLVDYRNQIEPAPFRLPSAVSDPQYPAPTPLAANAVSDTQVRLDWFDGVTNETAFLVERSLPGSNLWAPVNPALPSGTISHIDSNAAPSTAYNFRIRSIHSNGFALFAVSSATTPAPIGDGIPGWWRYEQFGNGVSILPGVSGAADNPDGDEFDNLAEFQLGTRPADPRSVLRPSILRQGTNALIRFESIAGKRYRVERTHQLQLSPWPVVLATNLPGTGGPIEVQDPSASGFSELFYRIRLDP
jgi:hypothetical protein